MSHDYERGRFDGAYDAHVDAERTRNLGQAPGYPDGVDVRPGQGERVVWEAGGALWTEGALDPSVPVTVTRSEDPASMLLRDGHRSVPKVADRSCYICNDPEFAAMGLPLCKPCPMCAANAALQGLPPGHYGHVPADDIQCSVCGYDGEYDEHMGGFSLDLLFCRETNS